MPVAEMANYSALVRAGEGNEPERIALMEAHAAALDEQIQALMASRAVIGGKIDAYRTALIARGALALEPS